MQSTGKSAAPDPPMQSTGKSAAPDPPMHAQLSSPRADIATLKFANDRYLWASEAAMQPIRGHCNNCRLLSRLKRNRGNRRFQLHPVILPVLVAAATTYLLLRCAWHLGASKKHNGLLRSVAAVGEEGEGCEEPCVQGFQGESTVAAVEGEVLEEERVLERTRRYTLDLVQVVLESRSMLLRMPPAVSLAAVEGEVLEEERVLERTRRYTLDLVQVVLESRSMLLRMPPAVSTKVLTNVLRLCILELSALCSLLEPRERQTVEHAVQAVVSEVIFLRSCFTRKLATPPRVRHISRMRVLLREVPGTEFTGGCMTPVERLSKLGDLITLQQVALTQVQGGMRLLAARCQQETKPCSEEATQVYIDDLCKTTEARRNHIFQDALLSKWLRSKHCQGPRYGLVSPSVIETISAIPSKPHKELLKELLNTPLGLSQQQSSPQGRGQVDAHGDGEEQQVETTPSPPKGLSTSEAAVKSGESAGVGATMNEWKRASRCSWRWGGAAS
ncbi:hypothetical protein, conserved [Eimeria praecox]|uniref:Transmembrane protein n=1 Tax=Eimeria praecox TaxID=51316 RepID=U6G5B3_9EIME|nr:hypothetical protein, conserved [Eimeria praecox]